LRFSTISAHGRALKHDALKEFVLFDLFEFQQFRLTVEH